jgi:hypothetical protein
MAVTFRHVDELSGPDVCGRRVNWNDAADLYGTQRCQDGRQDDLPHGKLLHESAATSGSCESFATVVQLTYQVLTAGCCRKMAVWLIQTSLVGLIGMNCVDQKTAEVQQMAKNTAATSSMNQQHSERRQLLRLAFQLPAVPEDGLVPPSLCQV